MVKKIDKKEDTGIFKNYEDRLNKRNKMIITIKTLLQNCKRQLETSGEETKIRQYSQEL